MAATEKSPVAVEEKESSKDVSPKSRSYAEIMKEKSNKSAAAKATNNVKTEAPIVEVEKEVEAITEEKPVLEKESSEEKTSKKKQKQKKKKEQSVEKEIVEKEKSPKVFFFETCFI